MQKSRQLNTPRSSGIIRKSIRCADTDDASSPASIPVFRRSRSTLANSAVSQPFFRIYRSGSIPSSLTLYRIIRAVLPKSRAAAARLPSQRFNASIIRSRSNNAVRFFSDPCSDCPGRIGCLQRWRQMVPVNNSVAAQQYRSLNTVLQLTHVARPMIRHHHVNRRRTDPPDIVTHFC